MMPWRCRGGDSYEEQEEEENRKKSEVGKKIFQIAAEADHSPITRSPKKGIDFDDIQTETEN